MPSFHRDCVLESGALPGRLVRVSSLSFRTTSRFLDVPAFRKCREQLTPPLSPRLRPRRPPVASLVAMHYGCCHARIGNFLADGS